MDIKVIFHSPISKSELEKSHPTLMSDVTKIITEAKELARCSPSYMDINDEIIQPLRENEKANQCFNWTYYFDRAKDCIFIYADYLIHQGCTFSVHLSNETLQLLQAKAYNVNYIDGIRYNAEKLLNGLMYKKFTFESAVEKRILEQLVSRIIKYIKKQNPRNKINFDIQRKYKWYRNVSIIDCVIDINIDIDVPEEPAMDISDEITAKYTEHAARTLNLNGPIYDEIAQYVLHNIEKVYHKPTIDDIVLKRCGLITFNSATELSDTNIDIDIDKRIIPILDKSSVETVTKVLLVNAFPDYKVEVNSEVVTRCGLVWLTGYKLRLSIHFEPK